MDGSTSQTGDKTEADELLDKAAVMRLAGRSSPQIGELIRAGKLPVVKVGRRRRFRLADVAALVAPIEGGR